MTYAAPAEAVFGGTDNRWHAALLRLRQSFPAEPTWAGVLAGSVRLVSTKTWEQTVSVHTPVPLV